MTFPEEPGNGNETDFRWNGSLPVYNASRESYGNFSDNIPDEKYFFANFSYPGTIQVWEFFSFLLCVVLESLPPANAVVKVMSSVMFVCLFTGGLQFTILPWCIGLHDTGKRLEMFKLVQYGPHCTGTPPSPSHGTPCYQRKPSSEPHAHVPAMFKLVQNETWCRVGEPVVGILLECFLMYIFVYSA